MSDSAASAREWKSATDPKSGRDYYYNVKSRETTWNKPLELATPAERQEMINKKNETVQFFREMEARIKQKIADAALKEKEEGDILYESPINREDSREDGISRMRFNSAASGDGNHVVSVQGRARLGSISGPPSRRVRTISTMDDEVLMMMRQSSGDDRRSALYARNRTNQINLSDEKLTPDERKQSLTRASGAKDSNDIRRPAESKVSVAKAKSPSSTTNSNSRKRRNSTGTIYIANTMSAQDNDATIHCVCAVVRAHMITGARENQQSIADFNVFKDTAFLKNIKKDVHPLQLVPSLAEVKQFFKFVFEKSQLESDCIIMALIYCERLVKETKGRLCIGYDNWRSILFACLVMASKVWDDLSMWNSDFSQVYPSFDLGRVNTLEIAMLEALKYIIRVPASEYAKYYFHLRSMMVRLGVSNALDPNIIKPLNYQGAKKLELFSEQYSAGFVRDAPAGGGGGEADGEAIRRRRHLSMHEGLNQLALQRNISENVSHAMPARATVGLEQIMHNEHMDADGGEHNNPMRKKSSQNMMISPRGSASNNISMHNMSADGKHK